MTIKIRSIKERFENLHVTPIKIGPNFAMCLFENREYELI